MVLRIHGKDESVVRFRQGAPDSFTIPDTNRGFFLILDKGVGKNLGKNVRDMAQ